uniref:Replication protein A 70 kDa DNA-binding subunit B/D first OB fold domain-containing protein n=1 Tax=Brassica oleracea var. oleracea TaxID=109376 RepID=A0A0D3CU25_BRAOL
MSSSPTSLSTLFASEELLSSLLVVSSAFGIQDSVIHGFIPANRASHYRPDLKSGSILKVDRFEVARCAHMYKITEHQFVICFIPSTRICEVLTDAPLINSEKFMVRRYDHLHILSNTDLELPVILGEIRSVQGSDLRNDAATTRVVVRLLIEP